MSLRRPFPTFFAAAAVLVAALALMATPASGVEPDAKVPATGTSGVAGPYPITQTVAGRTGLIYDVDVTLSGITHSQPDDLDILLVSPQGQAVLLMSDACGTQPVTNATWTWDDDAFTNQLMPRDTACASGQRFQPTNYVREDMPLPAPAGTYAAFLNAFNYASPNGDWRMYAADDSLGGYGYFTNRFALDIKTRPPAEVGFYPDKAIDLVEGQSRELTLFRSSQGFGSGAGSVTITSRPISASASDFSPASTRIDFPAGQLSAKVPVQALTDSKAEGDERFEVTVTQPDGDARSDPATSTAVVTIHDPPAKQPDPGTGGQPDRPGTGQAVDRTAPIVRGLRVRRRTVRYSLSERAAVALRFERVVRRRGRASRYVAAGTLRRSGAAGANRISFGRRLGRRALRAGTYRLVVAATDAAGNRSTSRSRRFRISNPKRRTR